jgi:hypothetical protein
VKQKGRDRKAEHATKIVAREFGRLLMLTTNDPRGLGVTSRDLIRAEAYIRGALNRKSDGLVSADPVRADAVKRALVLV